MPEANEMVVGMMAVVAQAERKMISQRRRVALAAAKTRHTADETASPCTVISFPACTVIKLMLQRSAKSGPIILLQISRRDAGDAKSPTQLWEPCVTFAAS